MSKSLTTMSPAEIAAEGRRLINLARKKEADLKNKTTLAIGTVFNREFNNGWSTPTAELAAELEAIMGGKVNLPAWYHDQSFEEVLEQEIKPADNLSINEVE